jgi:DNA polymerase-1
MLAYYVATGLGDPTLAAWFREGRDFYTEIAAKVYGKPESEITKDERDRGKMFYLMILYGAGPKKIALETGMVLSESRDFYQQFHEGLPWIKALSNPPPSNPRGWNDYQPGLIERVLKQRGYLKTPWGRRLHPEKWGEFKMLNRLIQGSSADLMKLAISKVAQHLRMSATHGGSAGLHSRLVLTVHDELVLDGPEREIPELNFIVPKLMIDEAINEIVPLGVDHEISVNNLAEKQSYEEWKESSGRSNTVAGRAA